MNALSLLELTQNEFTILIIFMMMKPALIFPAPPKGVATRSITNSHHSAASAFWRPAPHSQGIPHSPQPIKKIDVAVHAEMPTVRAETDIDRMSPLLDSLKWDNNGLVVAIAQHIDTGEVLMQAFADRAAINETLQTG